MVKNTFKVNAFKLINFLNHHFKSFCPSNHQCKHLLQFLEGLVHIWYKKKCLKKKKDYPFLRFECFEHAKTFLICVNFLTCKLCN